MSDFTIFSDLAVVSLVAGITGLICRWLNLSAVVGFLVAGFIIGPYTPPFSLVSDEERINTLANLGLLILVFGIGLGFSIRRMQRLGPGLVLGTAIAALLVLASIRMLGSAVGLNHQQALFVAAVLMVSSSAIISKVLEEIGSNHTRWGQLALGVTLLEDIVAVIMLTLLSSLTVMGVGTGAEGQEQSSLWQSITSFTGFVAVFFTVVLLLVPRLLRALKDSATPELLMLLTTGTLMTMGWLAVQLGYSMALTAFILGAIIGSTPHRPEIDRLFEGMRHLFGAIFFVAMGMLFNVKAIGEFWPIMLALTAGAFLLRMPAMVAALVLTGSSLRDALRAAATLTPLGEFSFVIALLATTTKVLPETFYPAAVGASLLTCLISPVLIRKADPLSEKVELLLPEAVKRGIVAYHNWLELMQERRSRSVVWKLMAPRVVQTLIQLLVVAGLLALGTPAYAWVLERFGADAFFPSGTRVLFVLGLGAVVLAPLVAVWRNISALSMMAAEATTAPGQSAVVRLTIERAFFAAAATFAALWLTVLIPADLLTAPILGTALVGLLLLTVLLWRKLVLWHSRVEVRLRQELLSAQALESLDDVRRWKVPSFEENACWSLHVQDHPIPMNSCHAGQRLIDLDLRRLFSCSVVGIDRQGFAITNPSAQERLYPGDRVLLLGSRDAVDSTITFLNKGTERPDWMQQFDDLGTEFVTVPSGWSCVGKTLRDLDLINRFGVQIGGIRRNGKEIVSPAGTEVVHPGDELLLLGTHNKIRDFVDAM